MQTNGKTKMTRRFYPEVHVLANTLVSVVSIAHLVVRRLIGITHQAHTLGTARTYPESEGSSTTRSTRFALRGSMGRAQCPSQSLLQSTAQSSMRDSTQTTTKPSRRWKLPRVTSTTGLQLDHLVPLDAITQCNTLEIAHFVIGSHPCKHK